MGKTCISTFVFMARFRVLDLKTNLLDRFFVTHLRERLLLLLSLAWHSRPSPWTCLTVVL